MSNPLFSKTALRNSVFIVVAIAAAVVVVGVLVSRSVLNAQATAQNSMQSSDNAIEVDSVGAFGRLEPQGEAIRLSAPVSQEGARVEQLLVQRGDSVQAGQIIAILDTYSRQSAALEGAKQQVEEAKARLAQVKAGAKAGTIRAQASSIERIEAELQGESAAQAATLARLESKLRNAETEYRRYQQLYESGAISASERDDKLLVLETSQKQLTEAQISRSQAIETLQDQLAAARATLDEIQEVRPTDVQVAQAELNSAEAAVKEAEANLERTYIRAPKAGQILDVGAYPGEVISSDGVVVLGQTEQMYAVAEVYETDISRVRAGQHAKIMSQGFTGTLQGVVDEVGLQVAKKDVLNTDPAADVDVRVVEVKIRLDAEDSRRVAGLTNLQINAVIDVTP